MTSQKPPKALFSTVVGLFGGLQPDNGGRYRAGVSATYLPYITCGLSSEPKPGGAARLRTESISEYGKRWKEKKKRSLDSLYPFKGATQAPIQRVNINSIHPAQVLRKPKPEPMVFWSRPSLGCGRAPGEAKQSRQSKLTGIQIQGSLGSLADKTRACWLALVLQRRQS